VNIIIFAPVDFPDGPATTSRIKHIAKILDQAGNKVTIASLQANTKIPYPNNTRTEGTVENIHFIYLNGTVVRPSNLVGALADTLRGCLGAFSYLLKMKRKQSADLILFYTPDFFQVFHVLILAKLCRIPVVLEMCEMSSTMRLESLRQRVRLISAYLSDRILPKISSGIIVISHPIKEWLLAGGLEGDKIFLLPILVDCRKFNEPSMAEVPLLAGKKYFLNSGGLVEKDGAKYLLDALALMGRKHEDVNLVFTGEPDSPRKQSIVDLAKKLGIEKQVIFTGFLPLDQLVWAYQNAQALLCCRSNSPYANFGSPTKLSEYLSTGKPVITNDVGDNKIYLVKNKDAFFARVEDVESIAEQMTLVLAEPAAAAKVGREGQKVAQERFHFERYVASLDAFLKGVCKAARL